MVRSRLKRALKILVSVGIAAGSPPQREFSETPFKYRTGLRSGGARGRRGWVGR